MNWTLFLKLLALLTTSVLRDFFNIDFNIGFVLDDFFDNPVDKDFIGIFAFNFGFILLFILILNLDF